MTKILVKFVTTKFIGYYNSQEKDKMLKKIRKLRTLLEFNIRRKKRSL